MSGLKVSQILEGTKYRDKLNSQEWRSFAAEEKQKQGGYCRACKRADVALQVHHIFYESGREPWHYKSDELVVLCDGCHKELHEQLAKFRRYVFGKMTPQVFQILNGALAVAFAKYDPLVFVHALAEFVSTPTMVQRYANAWGMDAQKKKT